MLEMDLIKEKFLSATSGPIGFRLLSRVDCYPLLDACANEEFNKHLAWNATTLAEELMPKIESLIRETQMGKSLTFSAVDKNSGSWIGITKWTPYKDSYMSSTWAHPKYWGSRLPVEYIYTAHHLIMKATQKSFVYAVISESNTKTLSIAKNINAEYVQDVLFPHENGTSFKCKEFKVYSEYALPKQPVMYL